MIIKKIYGGAFGKLSDFTLELKSGINVIYGENEAGKSTVQALIKAMLYGMNSQKKDLRENHRKRYMPWSGEKAFGKLYIEDEEGNTFIISKTFGKMKREDQSEIHDSVTGEKVVYIDADMPGRSILGIGEDAFEKTLMISALGAEVVRDKDDEIMQRLLNLQQTGESGVSYQKALKKLEEAKKNLTNVRKSGKLDELKILIYNLNEEKREIIKLHEESVNCLMTINNLKNEKDKIISSIELIEKEKSQIKIGSSLTEYLHSNEKLNEKNYALEEKRNKLARLGTEINEKLRQGSEFDELLMQYEAFEKLDDHVESKVFALDEEKRSIEKRLKELQEYKEELYSLKLQLDEQKAELDKYKNISFNDKKSKGNRYVDILIMILGVILTLIGIMFGLIRNSFFYILTLIGLAVVISTIISIGRGFFKIKEHNKSGYGEYGQAKDKKDEIVNNIVIISTKLEEKEKILQTFNEAELSSKLEKNIKFLQFIFNHCDVKDTNEFTNRLNNYKDLKKDVTNIHKDLYLLKNEYSDLQSQIFSLEGEIRDYLVDEYDHKIKDNTNSLVDIEKQIKGLEGKLNFILKDKRELSLVEEEILEKEEKVKEYELILSATNVSIEVLKEAFYDIQRSFGPRLNISTAKILGEITSSKYDRVFVGEDYTIKLTTQGEKYIKDMDYFSSGTSDQIYLALRLALAQILFENKFLYPIILDDPFTQYDDKRLENTLEFLVKHSSIAQIIIFSCQSREFEYLKDRCNYIRL